MNLRRGKHTPTAEQIKPQSGQYPKGCLSAETEKQSVVDKPNEKGKSSVETKMTQKTEKIIGRVKKEVRFSNSSF